MKYIKNWLYNFFWGRKLDQVYTISLFGVGILFSFIFVLKIFINPIPELAQLLVVTAYFWFGCITLVKVVASGFLWELISKEGKQK